MQKNFFYVATLTFFVLYLTPIRAEIVVDLGTEAKKTETPENTDKNPTKIEADILKFKNKDSLHGKMISLQPGKGILWKSDDTADDILFSMKNVKEIKLGNYIPGKNNNTSVLLTNGDNLEGKLISLDKDKLILDSSYGGSIKINRHMINSIFPGESNTGLLYKGPNDISEWEIPKGRNSGEISIADNTLVMNGYCSIGRDMKLPDMAKIEFNFENSGNCQMQVLFFSDKVVSYPKNCYVLYLSSSYIYLQSYGPQGRSGNLGNVSCRQLRSGKGKITLLLDRKDKKYSLLVNDTMIKQWVESREPPAGTKVSFTNQSQGTIKIKNLEVSSWNGKVPGSNESKESSEKDIVTFINGDQVTGILQSIKNNETLFKTEYAELKIPLKRIKQILTASENQHRARRNAGDVRFLFPNGNKLTMELAHIKEGKIFGQSENFGDITLNQNAFKSIKLNIYDDID